MKNELILGLGFIIWLSITIVIGLTLLLIRKKRLNKEFRLEASKIWEERYALADAKEDQLRAERELMVWAMGI